MFLGSLPEFLSFDWVVRGEYIVRRFLGEHVLDGQNFVEKLEFLLCHALVRLINRLPIKFFDLLETVDDETAQCHTIEDLIVIHLQTLN